LCTSHVNVQTLTSSAGTACLSGPGKAQLKAITIGKGTQNYTCASSDDNTKPVSTGAVAILWNATPLLAILDTKTGVDLLNRGPAAALEADDKTIDQFLGRAGKHFFNAAGAPVFDLTSSHNGFIVSKKDAAVDAPKDSVHGQFGNAVPWLELSSIAGSVGLTKVYRVHTAAGAAPKTCKGQPKHIEVPYAAQYFFYQ
jgi:hypothetical protein